MKNVALTDNEISILVQTIEGSNYAGKVAFLVAPLLKKLRALLVPKEEKTNQRKRKKTKPMPGKKKT